MRWKKSTLSLLIWAALSSTTPAAADETPPTKPAETPSLLERTSTTLQDLLLKGLEMVGVNYRRGGTNPDSGLDCSGFVQRVFQDSIGLLLPRTAKEMSGVGAKIEKAELQPGDLVFFNTMRRAFSHVGIYLGDSKFLHAPRPGGEVRVDDMRGSYWAHRFDGARRVAEVR